MRLSPGTQLGQYEVVESIGAGGMGEVYQAEVRAHIHGHIHKCFGREGIHFNVASGRAFRAMGIDIEEMEHVVLTRKTSD